VEIVGYSLIKTEGAGYAIAGLIDNYGAGGVYLINTDSEGTMLWNKTYGGLSGERTLLKFSGIQICGIFCY